MATYTPTPTKSSWGSAVLGGFIVLLVVLAVAGWGLTYERNTSLTNQLALATSQRAAHDATAQARGTEVADYQIQEAASAMEIARLERAARTQEAQFHELESDFVSEMHRADELESQVEQLSDDVTAWESAQSCGYSSATIDYGGNGSVSRSLEMLVENEFERVDTANWTVLWEGDRTAYHELDGATGTYFLFVVYFATDYDRSATYDVFNACWID